MNKITVFTPTYNRVHTLPALYRSLCTQQCKDFEWLVVDDGSTDGTSELIADYQQERIIDIRYIRQTNGGKHRAINRGVALADGYLFMIVDSDDFLSGPDVIERIVEAIPFLEYNPQFCAVVGNRVRPDRQVIGTPSSYAILDSDFFEYREKYKIAGDRAEVIKTSVMREYPFPEIPGERFCPEGLIWGRMARKYKARYLNEPFVVCEYLPGGLSDTIRQLRRSSPQAYTLYYGEYIHSSRTRFISRLKNAVAYWAVYFFNPSLTWRSAYACCGPYTLLWPIGWLLYKINRF